MQIEKLITDILRCNIPHEKKERLFELVTTETREIEEFIGSNIIKLYMLKKSVRSILEMWKSYENL